MLNETLSSEALSSYASNSDFVAKLKKITSAPVSESEHKKLIKSISHHKHYYPAPRLPRDCVLVVRTDALRKFELLISDKGKNIDSSTVKSNTNGHKERHAQKREQILGAAFAKWPDECRDTKGGPVASKIANMIETKADLFWADAQPPLATDSIADHLREWIKKTNCSRK